MKHPPLKDEPKCKLLHLLAQRRFLGARGKLDFLPYRIRWGRQQHCIDAKSPWNMESNLSLKTSHRNVAGISMRLGESSQCMNDDIMKEELRGNAWFKMRSVEKPI